MENRELHEMDDSLFLSLGSEPVSPSGSAYPTRQAKNDDGGEYVAELTRQMANYMLQDDEKLQKIWGGSGSPQSTLWSPFGFASGSPIGPSREPSPPLTPAPTEMVKAKDVDINPIPFPSKHALIDDQIRSAKANFRKMKEEKEKREQRIRNDGVSWNRGRPTATAKHYGYGGCKRSGYGGSYQRNGLGVKAVFVDGSGSRPTGSAGTGVFLPRGTCTVTEPRKNTGCSTVIIPARVVEALKHHFDKMGVPSKFTSDFPPHHDALLVAMKTNNINNGKNSSSAAAARRRQPYAEAVAPNSHREPPAYLPPEWTY